MGHESMTRRRVGVRAAMLVVLLTVFLLPGRGWAAPFAYISTFDDFVSVVDIGTGMEVATIDIAPFCTKGQSCDSYWIAASADETVIATSMHDADVAIIDACTNTVLGVVNIGNSTEPEAIAVNSDGSIVYVADEDDNELYAIDVGSLMVIAGPIDLSDPDPNEVRTNDCFEPENMVISPDDSTLYIACAGDAALAVATSDFAITIIDDDAGAHGIVINSTGTRVYYSDDTDIFEWNTGSEMDTGTVYEDCGLYNNGKLSADDSQLFCVEEGSDLCIYEVSTGNLLNTGCTDLGSGIDAAGVQGHPDGGVAYVTTDDDFLLIVETVPPYAVVGTIFLDKSADSRDLVIIEGGAVPVQEEFTRIQPAGTLIMPFDQTTNHASFQAVTRPSTSGGSSPIATHWSYWSDDCRHLVDVIVCLTPSDTKVMDPAAVQGEIQLPNPPLNALVGSITDLAGERGLVTVTAFEASTGPSGLECNIVDPEATVQDEIFGGWVIADTSTSAAFGSDAVGVASDSLPSPATLDDGLDILTFNPQSLGDSEIIVIGLELSDTSGNGRFQGLEIGPIRRDLPDGSHVCCDATFTDNLEVTTSLPDYCFECVAFNPVSSLQGEPGSVSVIPPNTTVESPGFVRLANCVTADEDGLAVPIGDEFDQFLFAWHGQAIGPFGAALAGKYPAGTAGTGGATAPAQCEPIAG